MDSLSWETILLRLYGSWISPLFSYFFCWNVTFLSSHPEIRGISVPHCGVRSSLVDSLNGSPCLPIFAVKWGFMVYDGVELFGESNSEVSC